ncbi:protein RKD1-like isoform X1 [Asparagus officinalis]|nr:protein RKD1-like isoform X1 [Asparagus officinalis]
MTAPDYLELSGFPHWRDWQLDFPVVEEDVVEAVPLMQRYQWEPLFPPHDDLFEVEFNTLLDEENHRPWESTHMTKKRNLIEENNGKEKELCIRGSRDEKNLTFEEVSKYFYMPITQAARELHVGLTLLKKKCRELGIPRWPHRKMKSLQALIKNVQELEREEGEAGEVQLRSTIEILEQEKKLMEKKPDMKLEEKTKRLRQACFKANYKKRRLTLMSAAADQEQHSPASLCNGSVLEYFNGQTKRF